MSTYQTFVVRTPKHTILIDTCTGEDKGYPPPMDFPKKPWLDGFHALGLTFDAIDYVFCTHLHVDHTGWNTRLENGRWVPTFPRAKYIFHRREYEFWEQNAKAPAQPAHSPAIWLQNCRPIVEAGRAELVDENFSLDDTRVPVGGARPLAASLLRAHPLARPGSDRLRRPDAPRAAMPRARLVDHLLLGHGDGGADAAALPASICRHPHAGDADPLPGADRRPHRARRRALPLPVRV